MSHREDLHNPQLSSRVNRSAIHYLNNLQEHARTQAVIITVEACGCVNLQTTMSDELLAATLMQANALRHGESDH